MDSIKEAFGGDLMKELALPDILARTEDAATSFARFQRIQTDSGRTPLLPAAPSTVFGFA